MVRRRGWQGLYVVEIVLRSDFLVAYFDDDRFECCYDGRAIVLYDGDYDLHDDRVWVYALGYWVYSRGNG